jgi:hypothetical protein
MGNDSPPVKSPAVKSAPVSPLRAAQTAENNGENNRRKPLNDIPHLQVADLQNVACKFMNAESWGCRKQSAHSQIGELGQRARRTRQRTEELCRE